LSGARVKGPPRLWGHRALRLMKDWLQLGQSGFAGLARVTALLIYGGAITNRAKRLFFNNIRISYRR
jgi:hypothetical protein